MGLLAGLVLLVALFAWTFWPERDPVRSEAKSRIEYLRERRDTVYENLRDLNFEHKAGKYPAEDFERHRATLESEAATILAEMDTLESVR